MYDARNLPLRLVEPGERGVRFGDLLRERLADKYGARDAVKHAATLSALVQEWSRACDELEREPTIQEYADRFGIGVATAHRDLKLFREAFPSETTPGRLVKLFWDARSSWGALLSAEVVAE